MSFLGSMGWRLGWFWLGLAVVSGLYFLYWMFWPRTFSLDFEEYRESHPDLCEYLPRCGTFGQAICHHALSQACSKRQAFEEEASS